MKNLIIIDYDQQLQLELQVQEISQAWIKGHFTWSKTIKEQLVVAETAFGAAHEDWYLDEQGNRLEGDLLFEKSPWAMIQEGKYQKLVRRYLNFNTGEVWFCDQPWARIGDWWNNSSS